MDARLIHERLECKDIETNKTEPSVRTLLNDAFIAIPECQHGPGFSCSFEGYKTVIDERINNSTYAEACGVDGTHPQYSDFYWNWKPRIKDN